MNRALAEAFPHVYCELDFTNPLELTVATILSAQSTDKRVNLTTPALFEKYRTALDYAQADRAELEELYSAHRLLPEQGQLIDRAGPGTRRAVRLGSACHAGPAGDLPGVGRKTANVILGNAFDVPASPSTPISVDWCVGGGGPPRRTR